MSPQMPHEYRRVPAECRYEFRWPTGDRDERERKEAAHDAAEGSADRHRSPVRRDNHFCRDFAEIGVVSEDQPADPSGDCYRCDDDVVDAACERFRQFLDRKENLRRWVH